MVERKLLVAVSCFEMMLHHSNLNLCFARSGCDSSFIEDVVDKARTIERAKVFIPAIAFASFDVSVAVVS